MNKNMKATMASDPTKRLGDLLPKRYQRAWRAICRRLPANPNIKDILRALVGLAPQLRPATFCEYRRAITLMLSSRPELAAQFGSIRQRQHVHADWKPPRKVRKRSIAKEQIAVLIDAARFREQDSLAGAMSLVSRYGMRAAELPTLEMLSTETGSTCLHIRSAKRTSVRGNDRKVPIAPEELDEVRRCVEAVQGLNVRAAQMALYRLDLEIHSSRKQRITFHRIRHQLASNAKADGIALVDLAALLGHRSTKSTRSYGDARRGTKGTSIPQAIPETMPRDIPLPWNPSRKQAVKPLRPR